MPLSAARLRLAKDQRWSGDGDPEHQSGGEQRGSPEQRGSHLPALWQSETRPGNSRLAGVQNEQPRLTGRWLAGRFRSSLFEDPPNMSVVIRLTRAGAKKVPFYRVVAADRRSPRDGRFIEQLGVYDPIREPIEFRVNEERLKHWLSVGAVPSETMSQLLRRQRRAAPPATAA
jgi:small subunit ribosomal protein S16